MLSKDEAELLERRLSEQVRERAVKILSWRYGTYALIFVSIASFFGYNTYWDVNNVRGEIAALNKTVSDLESNLSAFHSQYAEIEKKLENAETKLREIAELSEQIQPLEEKIHTLDDQTQNFADQQAVLLLQGVESLIEESGIQSVRFYEGVKNRAEELQLRELLRYATLRLAISLSRHGASSAAEDNYDLAEELAAAMGPAQYFDVLFARSDENSFVQRRRVALTILETKGLSYARSTDEPLYLAEVHQKIGDLYSSQRNNEQSLLKSVAHYQNAIEAFNEVDYKNRDIIKKLARINRIIGDIYADLSIRNDRSTEQYHARSTEHFDRSIDLARSINERNYLLNAYTNFAVMLFKSGNETAAKRNICEAAMLANQVQNSRPDIILSSFAAEIDADGADYNYELFCSE